MTTNFEFKVVVAGPFSAGKTTMILAASEKEVVGTEAPTSGDEAKIKDTTTVGVEFGSLSAAGEDFSVELSIYGVPGQERFSFMWDIVGVGMDGLFLIVDAGRPETWEQSATVAAYFQNQFPCPVVVGVNRASESPEIVEQVRDAVPIPGAHYLGFEVVDREGARDALVELLFVMLDEMDDDDDDDHVDENSTDQFPEMQEEDLVDHDINHAV